ncbi:MAG: hypothetical protein Rhob2KO_12570 [Rhodopirellula baltica]
MVAGSSDSIPFLHGCGLTFDSDESISSFPRGASIANSMPKNGPIDTLDKRLRVKQARRCGCESVHGKCGDTIP